jgi:cytoskeleton protein RodZ
MSAAGGPGPTLKAARQAMNVEPREVADALNLPLAVVEAIEDNNFAQLPNAVFARGYVRSYAKLLELDPDPIVQQFPMPEQSVTEPTKNIDQPSAFAVISAMIKRLVREQQQLVIVASAVIGGLLVVLLLVWLVSDSEAEAAISSTAPLTAPLTAPTAASLESAAPTLGARSSSSVLGTAIPAVTGAPQEVVSSAADGAVADGIVSQRLDAGEGTLLFEFTDECWLEIRAADGQVLYSDLGKPSRALQFTGSGPFSILLGYAPAAKLQLNGEAVALAPHTRNNVATLVLGQ